MLWRRRWISRFLGEPPISIEPCEGPFDYPAPRQHLEAVGGVEALDDFDGLFSDAAQGILEFAAGEAPFSEPWRSHVKRLRILASTSDAPSWSWMSAARTRSPSSSFSYSSS
jgi:hypothetical protein